MIKDLLLKTVSKQHLNEEEAERAMGMIMDGKATPSQIATLLTALRLNGETVDEITGFARAMRKRATKITCSSPLLVDTCGTGGDGSNTFNISTTVALVMAGADIKVAKHGNRSVTSLCGSADVLEALGVKLDLCPESLAECLEEVGIAFLYAPLLHDAMKYAVATRREIGFRTAFNLLGPLTNPAGAKIQIVGVYSPKLTRFIADVLLKLHISRAFVFHGAGGLDELSPLGPACVCEINNGTITEYTLEPMEIGIKRYSINELGGGTPVENAIITKKILSGEKGARRDTVLLNTAPGLVACGIARDLKEGVQIAGEIIDSGAAMKKLKKLISFTNNTRKQVAGL